MNDPEFYRQQIVRMRSEGAAADLPGVRERCERSADAWQVMLDRLERLDRLRAENPRPRLRT